MFPCLNDDSDRGAPNGLHLRAQTGGRKVASTRTPRFWKPWWRMVSFFMTLLFLFVDLPTARQHSLTWKTSDTVKNRAGSSQDEASWTWA